MRFVRCGLVIVLASIAFLDAAPQTPQRGATHPHFLAPLPLPANRASVAAVDAGAAPCR